MDGGLLGQMCDMGVLGLWLYRICAQQFMYLWQALLWDVALALEGMFVLSALVWFGLFFSHSGDVFSDCKVKLMLAFSFLGDGIVKWATVMSFCFCHFVVFLTLWFIFSYCGSPHFISFFLVWKVMHEHERSSICIFQGGGTTLNEDLVGWDYISNHLKLQLG